MVSGCGGSWRGWRGAVRGEGAALAVGAVDGEVAVVGGSPAVADRDDRGKKVGEVGRGVVQVIAESIGPVFVRSRHPSPEQAVCDMVIETMVEIEIALCEGAHEGAHVDGPCLVAFGPWPMVMAMWGMRVHEGKILVGILQGCGCGELVMQFIVVLVVRVVVRGFMTQAELGRPAEEWHVATAMLRRRLGQGGGWLWGGEWCDAAMVESLLWRSEGGPL